MNSKQITLEYPVIVNGQAVSVISLRSLKVGDLARVDRAGGSDLERGFNLLAAAADLDRAVVDEIDMHDLASLSLAMEELLGKSAPQGSGKPS